METAVSKHLGSLTGGPFCELLHQVHRYFFMGSPKNILASPIIRVHWSIAIFEDSVRRIIDRVFLLCRLFLANKK